GLAGAGGGRPAGARLPPTSRERVRRLRRGSVSRTAMKAAALCRLLPFCGLALLVRLCVPAPAPVVFTDVARQAGVTPVIVSGSREKNYILEVNGSGACWLDFNKDGYSDLYLVNGATLEQLQGKEMLARARNYLFRNNGDGTFTDVTLAAGVPGKGWGFGCA